MIALPPPPRRRHPTRDQWRVTRKTRWQAVRAFVAARTFDEWLAFVAIALAVIIFGQVAIVLLPAVLP